MSGAEFVRAAALGSRLVVRSRIPGGYTDALGVLRSVDDVRAQVETKRGLVTVELADIEAAKAVPPPPPPRAPRRPA